MSAVFAGIGLGVLVWLIINFFKWCGKKINPQSDYVTFGNSIVINGLTFYLWGEAYRDSTGTLLYGRHKTFGDCYWLAPSINLTQQQFFNKIDEIGASPNSRKVSRKRTT